MANYRVKGTPRTLIYRAMIAETDPPSLDPRKWGDWTGEFATVQETIKHVKAHFSGYDKTFGLFKYHPGLKPRWQLERIL